MESKIKDGNFTTIQSWMVKELGLKGNELLVYSIIYMFSQDGEGKFTGSLQYLADWTNSTKQGVLKNLQSLVNKGLLVKESKIINGLTFVEYYATKLNGVLNKVEWGIKQSLTNNKEENKEDNKELIIKENTKEKGWKYFDSPQLDEAFSDYVEMRKKIKAPLTDKAIKLETQRLFELSNGIESKMVEILNQSVTKCWKGLYQIKCDSSVSKVDWGMIYGDGSIQ